MAPANDPAFEEVVAAPAAGSAVAFDTHIITTSAAGAISVYAADVDGDGDLDVLSASPSDNKIAWYENDGSENFTVRVISTSAEKAWSVFAADVDSDGDMDVLSASIRDDGEIAWYENDGNENFTAHIISIDRAVSVFAADVDGDGDMDVLSAGGAKIAWYENDGSETFTPHIISTDVDRAYSVIASDVDGDGDMDVLSASYRDRKVAWYENDGNENFTPHIITTDARDVTSVFASDIDGDGDNDVFSAGGERIAWYENDGNEGFVAHTISTDAVRARSVFAADVDGDGDLDVLSASTGSPDKDSRIAWYENVGGRDFGDAPAPYPTTSADNGARHEVFGPTLGATRDEELDGQPSIGADGDGADEDGVTFGEIRVGQLDASVIVEVQNAPDGAKLDAWIDFNGDGSWGGPFDQIADRFAVTEGDNTISFDVPSWAASGNTYARFRLSTDGDLGVGGSAADGEVEDYQVTINPPVAASGVFGGPSPISQAVNVPESIFVADVDGDGDMDVLSASALDDKIAWYENDGNETFTAHTISNTANSARSVFAIDVDGDGDMDVLSASWYDDKIAWYENDGSENFTPHNVNTPDPDTIHFNETNGNADRAHRVFAADVDGDGDIDVLSASRNDDKIAWYENDGNETFTAHTISTAVIDATTVFAADMDGDGDIDVLGASYREDKIAWFENDGNGGFTARIISTAVRAPYSVFAADVDGDGDMDVLSASRGLDKIAWYENDGNETFTAHTNLDDASGAFSVFAADVDGDGDMDVLAGNDSGGMTWYENDGSQGFDRHIISTADRPRAVFAADVDSDGDIDVLYASARRNVIAWYKNLSRPLAENDRYSLNEEMNLSVDTVRGVLTNDSDADSVALTALLVNDVESGTLALNPDGSFTYEPTANFFGIDTFTYVANDGGLDSEPATVIITVSPIDDPSVAIDDAYETDEDTVLTVLVDTGVTTNDVELDGDELTAMLVDDVEHGSLVLNGDGTFSYTPDEDFFGRDQFSYLLDDGVSLSNVATVTIDVRPINDPPIAVDDSYGVFEDSVLSVAAGAGVLVDDRDVEDDDLVAELVEEPSHGNIVLRADGSFVYTPEDDFFGVDSFTYLANDGNADSSEATVTITVFGVSDDPKATDDAYSVDQDTLLRVSVAVGVLANDRDGDGDELSAVLVETTSNGALSLSPLGSFVYEPNAGFDGSDSFTYLARADGDDSNIATARITVRDVNLPPLVVDDAYSIDEGSTLSIGFDLVASAGKQTIAFTSFEEPVVGALEYTPAAGAQELGFTRLIDANNDGTFGDEDAGGTYGVVDSSDNLTLPFTDGSHGYETTGSNGGAALQPHTLITFHEVDLPDSVDVELSFDVFVAVRGYETPDLLKVWVEAFDGADTDMLTIIEVNGDQIDAGDGISEGQWNTYRLLIDEKYQEATLRIETSTNATSLGEGFIFDNIVFAQQTGAVWKYLDDGTDQDVVWRAADFDDTTWQQGPSELGYGDGDEATLVGFGDEADEKFVTTYFRHDFTVSAADEIAELYLHLKREDGAAVYLNGVEIARSNLPDDATFVTLATDRGGEDFVLFNVDPELLVDGRNVLAAEVHLGDQEAEDLSFDLRLVATTPPLVGILANDSDPEGDTMSAVLVAGPSNGDLVLNNDGTFTYTPLPEFNGTDTFTYRATGGDTDSEIGTVSIIIGSINDPPIARDDFYETAEDTTLIVDVDEGLLANDDDAEGVPLTLELLSDPSHGALTLNPDGSFQYEPELNFNGTDSYTYRISDGELASDIATVTLDVTPVNDRPVAVNDEYSLDQGESLFVPTGEGVLANDDDADDDELTVVLAGLPQHGIVALNADGSFLYQPEGDFVGVDEFSYQATDGELTSAVAMVEITVGSKLPADLTRNGFVDFEDLTVLLANWNQNVSVADGNLVDAAGTPVNFEDLTVLLAAWTGPGPAASPQPAATEATVQRNTPTENITATTARFDQLTRRAHTPSRRIDPSTKLSSHDSPLRRLQAGAVDRAMADRHADEAQRRDMISARGIRRGR